MSAKDHGAVRFPPIPDANMTADQRRVAARILETRKALRGPFNAMLRSPEVADLLQQVGAYIRFRAPASPRLKEFAIMMVARFWSAQFEWHAHRELAEKAGLESAKADAILEGRRPQGLLAEEAIVYRFVAQLLNTGGVTDDTFAAMKQRFGEPGLVDFITLVGYYCTASFFLNIDRHPLPPGAEPLPALGTQPFLDAEELPPGAV